MVLLLYYNLSTILSLDSNDVMFDNIAFILYNFSLLLRYSIANPLRQNCVYINPFR